MANSIHHKNLIKVLGFSPKENTSDIFFKKYADGYVIELNFDKKLINYGKKIKSDSKSTQNFSQSENWVVLECVNRLLEKGYKPKNITLEKTYPSGHGHSGRLDVCVSHDNGSEYLLIECKTWGKEFNKELVQTNKNGGQLFTYFKFSNKADIIMLYASELNENKVIYRNEIVKIEDDYRLGDVKDFYDKWNQLTKDNGIFDEWVNPYHFISKALTPTLLEPIKQEDSGFIFNRFLEILRHNVVSDKPNAFNKIFTLFLCKVYDEKSTKPNDELKFQWLEGKDDDISFQLRLADLYKHGMLEFLEKEVTDFSVDDFNKKYKHLDESIKNDLLEEFFKLRLEKNNEFAIKEVFDEQSFKENAKIVKEVVELLQGFRIRYNKRQQYLSDFFELLLTTGLKQESGQFFTPVPIAQFIIKSLPIDQLVDKKLDEGKSKQLLPYIMDFAAGSGHFLTESMHEIQRLLDKKAPDDYIQSTSQKITNWQNENFDWATQYVYGVEKDYRLVKVGKVGCYLHGDGLANVILSDGLANFKNTKEYKGVLKKRDKDFPKENKQFDIVISNPPYSVSSFKNAARDYYGEDDFALYSKLTDNSSEIECLFVERTAQLLKDGGVAGIILPSSILSNTGIYTKTREIILQNFDIVAIAELGSNTFMATGTNTVTLFLRRKNNYDSINLRKAVEKFFINLKDVTLNGVEKPVSKYVAHAWENVSFDDYKTLLQKEPNKVIQQHEIYQEYEKKIKSKDDQEKWDSILNIEEEKLFYFILAHPQKVVLVNSGQKKEEKQFLGYEFSNRRGREGIHPTQRGKNIDECTSLFDTDVFENPEKVSAYIYKAFKGDFDSSIHRSLQKNVSRASLVDMLTFDHADFEKNVSLFAKKKIKIESKWEIISIQNAGIRIIDGDRGKNYPNKNEFTNNGYCVFLNANNFINNKFDFSSTNFITKERDELLNNGKLERNDVVLTTRGTIGKVVYYNNEIKFEHIRINSGMLIFRPLNNLSGKFLYILFSAKIIQQQFSGLTSGAAVPQLPIKDLKNIRIPIPPKDIQERVVVNIEKLERKEIEVIDEIKKQNRRVAQIITQIPETKKEDLSNIATIISGQSPDSKYYNETENGLPFFQGKLDFSSVYLSSAKVWTTKVTKEAVKGDILMSVRAPVGDVNLNPFEKICIGRGLCAIRSNGEILQNFLWIYLKSIKDEIVSSGNQGAVFKAITKSQIETLKIPVLSLTEQKKIVLKIEQIESKITKLEKELHTIPKQKEQILKKYLEAP